MNILFQNPGLFWLTPLIGIPVLVHFLARARPPQYLFSATKFVLKVVKQTIRIKRPKDRLLLLCRTLVVIGLMLVFVKPVLFFEAGNMNMNLPRKVMIVIDRSASMAWSESGQSRFAAACEQADAILESLSAKDLANIIWLDQEPDLVFPEIGSNIAYLREQVKTARVGNEFGNAESALQLAVSQLESNPSASHKGVRELIVISDFQASQWQAIKTVVPDNIQVSTLWPAHGLAANGALTSIRTNPGSPLAGESVQVICDVGNFSNAPRNRTVTVKIGEKRVTRQVQIPAWGHGTISVDHVFTTPGKIVVSARLDEDAFGGDDWRALIVPVRSSLSVGLLGEDKHVVSVWQKALDALPWVTNVKLTDAALNEPGTYDILMIAGWQGQQVESILKLMQQQVAVVIYPAPGLAMENLDRLAGQKNYSATQLVTFESLNTPMGMQVADKTYKAFSIFLDGEFGDPAHGAFYNRLRLPFTDLTTHPAESIGKAILSFTDANPALMGCNGLSPLVVWLAPLSAESSDWAAQPGFLPFFGELLNAVLSEKTWTLPDMMSPGDTLSFKNSDLFDGVVLLDRNDAKIPIHRVDAGGQGIYFISEPIVNPGVYRLCNRQECPEVRAVNFPVLESDLRVSPPPVFTKAKSGLIRSASELKIAHEGASLWKIIIWVMLALIGIESLLEWLLYLEDLKLAKGS